MKRISARGASLLCVLALARPLAAQDDDRIWGRVQTEAGDVHEGFIRWDRNEGSWVDILDGTKTLPDENYRAWLAATGEEPAVRTIELRGYRISWDEDDPDFPLRVTSGIRFGHLASLTVSGDDAVEVHLRSGEVLELSGGSTDIGQSIRDIVVDVPGSQPVELRWRELGRIDFSAPPVGVRAQAPRLYGTVEDTWGGRYTGYVAWDLDEILQSDVLDGEEMRGGRERDVDFRDIAGIERVDDHAHVSLRDGSVLDLDGTNDVDDGNRGIQVSDPALGLVDVAWSDLRSVRFERPPRAVGYDAFDGGRPLQGTVVTRSGEELSGLVRWDADEGFTWELLNGRIERVTFAIEMGFVERIERGEAIGAIVTLRDGRAFQLDHSNDVDWDNKGVMVAAEDADPTAPGSWRIVSWEDLAEVRFHGSAPRP